MVTRLFTNPVDSSESDSLSTKAKYGYRQSHEASKQRKRLFFTLCPWSSSSFLRLLLGRDLCRRSAGSSSTIALPRFIGRDAEWQHRIACCRGGRGEGDRSRVHRNVDWGMLVPASLAVAEGVVKPALSGWSLWRMRYCWRCRRLMCGRRRRIHLLSFKSFLACQFQEDVVCKQKIATLS